MSLDIQWVFMSLYDLVKCILSLWIKLDLFKFFLLLEIRLTTKRASVMFTIKLHPNHGILKGFVLLLCDSPSHSLELVLCYSTTYNNSSNNTESSNKFWRCIRKCVFRLFSIGLKLFVKPCDHLVFSFQHLPVVKSKIVKMCASVVSSTIGLAPSSTY